MKCRICGNDVAKPFRVFDANGKVLNGCVFKDHDGHLVPASESSFWHNRKEAKAIRAKLNYIVNQ